MSEGLDWMCGGGGGSGVPAAACVPALRTCLPGVRPQLPAAAVLSHPPCPRPLLAHLQRGLDAARACAVGGRLRNQLRGEHFRSLCPHAGAGASAPRGGRRRRRGSRSSSGGGSGRGARQRRRRRRARGVCVERRPGAGRHCCAVGARPAAHGASPGRTARTLACLPHTNPSLHTPNPTPPLLEGSTPSRWCGTTCRRSAGRSLMARGSMRATNGARCAALQALLTAVDAGQARARSEHMWRCGLL